MEPRVVANDEPLDGEAAFMSDHGADLAGVSGKQERTAGDGGFLWLQKNIERSVRWIELGIVASAVAVDQIKRQVTLALRDAESATGKPQVHRVADKIAFWHFADGGYRCTPIIETLRFAKLEDATRQKRGHRNHDQHVNAGAKEQSPENAAGACELAA